MTENVIWWQTQKVSSNKFIKCSLKLFIWWVHSQRSHSEMTSLDIKCHLTTVNIDSLCGRESHQMTLNDINWHQVTSFDIKWHYLILNDITWNSVLWSRLSTYTAAIALPSGISPSASTVAWTVPSLMIPRMRTLQSRVKQLSSLVTTRISTLRPRLRTSPSS